MDRISELPQAVSMISSVTANKRMILSELHIFIKQLSQANVGLRLTIVIYAISLGWDYYASLSLIPYCGSAQNACSFSIKKSNLAFGGNGIPPMIIEFYGFPLLPIISMYRAVTFAPGISELFVNVVDHYFFFISIAASYNLISGGKA